MATFEVRISALRTGDSLREASGSVTPPPATGNATAGTVVATATTIANDLDLVYLGGSGFSVRVTNLNGGPRLYWTLSWPGGPCPVPSIGGTNCYVTDAVAGAATDSRTTDLQFGSIIQLISSGVTQYVVELQSVRARS